MADLLVPVGGAFAGRYVIEGELGHGATAAVYLARDLKHGRHVALKVLRPDLAASLESARFLREIRLLARLQHPHILPLFDSGEHEGALFYVMPRVEGETLGQRLRREQQISVGEALRITREVADALAYAHAHDVVHRDIKPDNILLDGAHALVADFGIARAVHRAVDSGGDRITSAGLAIGTPAYMSPEQASGEREVEGRSDIYSLACVLYEMLAGRYPFQGPSLQSMIARRFAGPPPPVSTLREGIPREVDAALTRALQPVPDARFQTVRDFCEALPPPTAETASVRPRRARRWPYVVAAVVIVIAVLLGVQQCPQPPVDADLYVVLPFEHQSGREAGLSGEQCELFLSEALSRWQDVRVVDPMLVKDARARRGHRPLSLAAALDVAAGLGAGRLLWGTVVETRDTFHVRAALYDVGARTSVRQHLVRIPADLRQAQPLFTALADHLLGGAGTTRRPEATRSLEAWHAFVEGHAALDRWQLDAAKDGFLRAVRIDPAFAAAQLWRAQVMAWDGDERVGELRAAAAQAVAFGDRLTARERLAAEALLALAESRYPAACERYGQLLARDSADFAAWFGLAECHAHDDVVVRDAASPSGWSFRGSHHAAAGAYRRALELVPSIHVAFGAQAFTWLSDHLYTEPGHFRSGRALPPDTGHFAAFPALAADTLAFVPYPFARAMMEGAASPVALARNRVILRGITAGWLREFPESPIALETHARILESESEVVASGSGEGALGLLERARATADSAAPRLRLAVMEVRLRLKAEDFARARALSDSLLRARAAAAAGTPAARPADEERYAALAALTGRVHRAAALLARAPLDSVLSLPSAERDPLPPPLAAAALPLLAYASFGAPAESIAVLTSHVDRLVAIYVDPARRRAVRRELLERPAVLAFAGAGPSPLHGEDPGSSYLLRLQGLLSRGDTAGARAGLAAVARQRAQLTGAAGIDATYQEARLFLALGDTTGAVAMLDAPLNALPSLGSHLLDEVPQAAALGRAMALRAELAASVGDDETARRWAARVLVLWDGADAVLHPSVQRMRALAGVTPTPPR